MQPRLFSRLALLINLSIILIDTSPAQAGMSIVGFKPANFSIP